MSDVYSQETRSKVMKAVHGKNTRPERVIRSALHGAGYRFRIHRNDLPGKPDIVLPRYRTIIFVNGCFWHQHPGCKKATIPQNNRPFWQKKLSRTIQRDAANHKKLTVQGWNVITIWECQIACSMDKTMQDVFEQLKLNGHELAKRSGI